jgi:HSP20 family protein
MSTTSNTPNGSSPFGLMRSFMDDIDRLMGGFGRLSMADLFASPFGRSGLMGWSPPVTVMERDGSLVVRADVPGLNPEDVRVEIEEGRLTISGERMQESKKHESGFYRNERSYGAFRRVIRLPEGVEPEHVSATFENGVLEVSVAMPQRKRAQRIEVKTPQQQDQAPPGTESSAMENPSGNGSPRDQSQFADGTQGTAV